MTDDELIDAIDAQRALMVSVSTGGPRIDAMNPEYIQRRELIRVQLDQRDIRDPNPYLDLWAWYGKWSSGDLPSYRSRRQYLAELYAPLIDRIRRGLKAVGVQVFGEPTGWAKVDRDIGEARSLLESASSEVQFQSVGLYCREVLISLSQAVFDPARHTTVDSVQPSETDAKRMLEAYIATELAGGSNEIARRHAKASVDLANELQHRRTATFRQAALCIEATTSVVNVVAIISGKRDPTDGAD